MLWECQTIVLYNPTGGIPVTATPMNVLDLAVRTKCDSLFGAPAFFKIWSSAPEDVEKLKTIRNVVRLSYYL